MSNSTNLKEQALSKKKINYLKNKWLIHIAIILLTVVPLILTSPALQIRENTKRRFSKERFMSRDFRYPNSPPATPLPLHNEREPEIFFVSENSARMFHEIFFYRTILLGIFLALIYLLNITYWVKILIQQKRIWVFIGIIFLNIIALIVSTIFLNYIITGNYFAAMPHPNLYLFGVQIPLMFIIFTTLLVASTFAVSTGIEITNDWIKQDEQRQLLENEKLQAELDFLKFQINPHFLFNTLNNIYSLAGDKSDDTEEAILMLSNLLRYTIYETNVDKIQLSKEIEQIENYINLQKLRLSAKRRVQINFEIIGKGYNYEIAPMLLIPFIENAFKHGISYLNNSLIEIYLQIETNQLIFSVMNQKNPVDYSAYEEHSGIGLKNVQRRLDLIYPQQYELNIQETEEMYKVELTLINI